MKLLKKLYLRLSDCDGMCNHCTGKLKEYCYEIKGKKEVITDYKGNKIKAGMVIKIIRVKNIYGDIKMYSPKGELLKITKMPEDIWECVGEYTITEEGGRLKYTMDCTTFMLSLFLSEIRFGLQESDLITIKGVSDEKQQ